MVESITKENWNILHNIMLFEWDPIGVKKFIDICNVDDEYDHYIDELYSILTSKNAFENTVNYLWYLENEHIGLPGDLDHTQKIAHLLLQSIKI